MEIRRTVEWEEDGEIRSGYVVKFTEKLTSYFDSRGRLVPYTKSVALIHTEDELVAVNITRLVLKKHQFSMEV